MNKRMIPFALLILLFNACFLPVVWEINKTARTYNDQTLKDMTEQTISELRGRLNQDLDRMGMAAGILSGSPALDGERTRVILREVQDRSEAAQAGFLQAGGRLLTAGEKILDSLSFDEELKQTPCSASVREIPAGSGKRYIFQSVPVKQDGVTKGILWEILNLETFSRRYDSPADGQIQFFVISGATGDYLIDTQNNDLGNLYEDSSPKLKVLSGSSQKQMKEDLLAGRSGEIEYRIRETGKAFFLYYAPVGLDDWMILLRFPQEYVFQAAIHIRKILYRMIWVELILFGIYLSWLAIRNYLQSARQERRISWMASQIDIQQTLFAAHQDPGCIQAALGKAAGILTAEKAFLISEGAGRESFFWPKRDSDRLAAFDINALRRDVPRVAETFLSGQTLLIDARRRALRPDPEERKVLRGQKVNSLMAVPVFNAKQELIGILGVINMRRKWSETILLEGIAHNFMMALENIRSYRIIERMGTVDALTGLQNRNSYQRALVERENDIQGCIYLDANGLHELNNQFGHAAGDAMLKAVGENLRETFGPEETYRIGGDEFVVLCFSRSRKDAGELLSALRGRIEGQGYHVSSGLAWREPGQDVSAVISLAEERMYADKQKYYEELGDPSRQMR